MGPVPLTKIRLMGVEPDSIEMREVSPMGGLISQDEHQRKELPPAEAPLG